MHTLESDKLSFLEKDFYDSLRWLFVGAIVWHAARTDVRVPHQAVLGMYTATTQARALYEFFHGRGMKEDDAIAKHFTSTQWTPPESDLYKRYMANGRPANKRIFHLVYSRAEHSGGGGRDEANHLKNRVLDFGLEILGLSCCFISAVDPLFAEKAERAVSGALAEADSVARWFGTSNPFRDEYKMVKARELRPSPPQD